MSEERPDGQYTQLDLIRQEEKAFQKFAALQLANDDVISVPKIYFDICDGDFAAAAILDEILFWTLPNKKRGTGLRVRKDGILWLAVGRADWYERKRLKKRQADLGIEKLVDLGLIEKSLHRFNGHAQTHLRVRGAQFFQAYGQKLAENYLKDDEITSEDAEGLKELKDLYAMMGMTDSPNGDSPNGDSPNGDSDSPNGDSDSPNGESLNSLHTASTQPPLKDIKQTFKKNSNDSFGAYLDTLAEGQAKHKPYVDIVERLSAGLHLNFPPYGTSKDVDHVAHMIALAEADHPDQTVEKFCEWATATKDAKELSWYRIRPEGIYGDWLLPYVPERNGKGNSHKPDYTQDPDLYYLQANKNGAQRADSIARLEAQGMIEKAKAYLKPQELESLYVHTPA